MKEYDLVVIGGGPAAITLAKMLGKKMSVAIIRPEDHSMIYCAMPYAIEGLLDKEQTLKKDSLVLDAGALLIRGSVESVNYDLKEVTLLDNSKISYKKLVLATGATPFIPKIPGNNLHGVEGFKTEKDLNRIKEMILSGLQKALVVGAGAIGIELAQAFAEAGVEVDLVDMASSILPNLVDPEITEVLLEELAQSKIKLHLNSKVVEIIGKEWAEGVRLDSGEEIQLCSPNTQKGMVIFASGMRAETKLAQNAGIDIGRDGIVVNNKMETTCQDVYAVGDCVQFKSGITGEIISGKLATNAVPMAKVLGFNLLGQNRTYPGFFNGAATKVGNFFVGSTGLTENTAKNNEIDVVIGHSRLMTKFPMMPGAKPIEYKLIANKQTKKIIGGQVLSGEPVASIIDLLTFAIQKGTLIDELTSLSYSSQPYQSYFPAANGIVMAAEKILAKFKD